MMSSAPCLRERTHRSAPSQCYLPNPLLVEGLKFDLRLYVVLTCSSPLQAYLSTRGVARFASHAWKPVDGTNQSDMPAHLKLLDQSGGLRRDEQVGASAPVEAPLRLRGRCRRSLDQDPSASSTDAHRDAASSRPCLLKRLLGTIHASGRAVKPAASRKVQAPMGGDPADGEPAHEQAGADQPEGPQPCRSSRQPRRHRRPRATRADEAARGRARRCFQILGFDVLDDRLEPWLLEVNHSPSMALAGNEDEEVEAKCSVVSAALKLGLSDDHTSGLCEACEVQPLHELVAPLRALEPVRTLFEAVATSRSAVDAQSPLAGAARAGSPPSPLPR